MIEVIATCATIGVLGARLRPVPERIPSAVDQQRPLHRRRLQVRLRHRAIGPAALAVWCDALSRSLRGGSTLLQAITTVTPPTELADALDPALLAVRRGRRLADALAEVQRPTPDLDVVLVVLTACAAHGGPAAEPIDRAGAALRQRAAIALERRTQSAHARASALVMTALPAALLAVLLVTSPPTRQATASLPGLVAVTLGLLFNVAGWIWMRRLTTGRSGASTRSRFAHRRTAAASAVADLPDLVELMVIAVRAGCVPAAALQIAARHAPTSLRPVLADVDHRLRRGRSFADALTAFSDALGPAATGFVDALATADRYGLALQPVLDRLSDDIRAERRAAAERDARTLAVRLAFPLVVCVLPAFTLVAIAPAVIGAISTLRGPA